MKKIVITALLVSTAFLYSTNTVYADEVKPATAKEAESKEAYELNSMDSILEACESYAKCQTDVAFCAVDVENARNPYDVEWDYGEKWQQYVDACDWSLVFDVKYYKKTFPMLAIQYNNDDELLFEHFRTVGVHEGRQGCKSFNVDAYRKNCSKEVYDALKNDIEGFYLYYMLNYDKEKKCNTVTANSGKKVLKQVKIQLTALQRFEFDGVNEWRKKVGVEEVKTSGEFNAFANCRAYLQRMGKYGMNNEGHIWARENKDTMIKYMDICFPENKNYALYENTITSKNIRPKSKYYDLYADHKDHYDAMVDATDKYIGISNCYYNKSINTASQYDLFVHEDN
ncbi:MAG: hypothetical protein MJZ11_14050 [Lachnospiraceae bacterium]|nr:hypothetical protein [Lachnospiraceae bacterium]